VVFPKPAGAETSVSGHLFEILNSRYVAKLPTMITTNEEDDLERWLGKAVLSRFFSHVMLLNMDGPDYRLSC
jgi:DNA replication protein DnaC